MSALFKDYFSGHAGSYARHRPHYPASLFEYLSSVSPGHDLAWDCGTGNGQAALGLSSHFRYVVGTDPSEEQLRNAFEAANVGYCRMLAEKCALRPASADLVTVAQALHWFDIERFFEEARAALRPGGVVAVWCYILCRVDAPVDAIIDDFYWRKVGPYWPKERKLVDDGYRSLRFPFDEWRAPDFRIELPWNLEDLLAYLRTWSPTRRYIEQNGRDPVDEVAATLGEAWGDPAEVKNVTWPIEMRIGRVE